MTWDEGDVVRMLAPSEQRFVRHGTYTGRSVSVIGRLDIDALRIAFAALRQEYPVLTARIGIDTAGFGYLLRPSPFGPSGLQAGYGDPAVVPAPPAQLDPGEQLAYVDVVLSARPRARVTLFVHHAVADGGFGVELFARLWEHYASWLETGTTHIVQPGRMRAGEPGSGRGLLERRRVSVYPEPLERHIERRGIGRLECSGFERVAQPLGDAVPAFGEAAQSIEGRASLRDDRIPAVGGAAQSEEPRAATAGPTVNSLVRAQRIVFDRPSTAALVARCRAQRISVNAVLTAAVLRAYARVACDGARARLGCLYPVDLRARLVPPVPVSSGTNMGGMASFAAEVDDSVELLELAARVADALHDDLAAGIVAQSVWHFPDYYGPARRFGLAGHIALTNTGVVPALSVPAGLRFADYEIVYLSAHPRPSQSGSAVLTIQSYTFAGRLTVAQLGGPDPRRLLGEIAAELGGAVPELPFGLAVRPDTGFGPGERTDEPPLAHNQPA